MNNQNLLSLAILTVSVSLSTSAVAQSDEAGGLPDPFAEVDEPVIPLPAANTPI